MKRGLVIAIILLLTGVSGFFGYRSYKANADAALAAQRLNADRAAAEERQAEAEKRATAEAEARRLAEEKAKADAAEAARKLAAAQAEQEALRTAQLAAQADAERAAAEKARLEKEKATAEAEAARLTAERQRDAAEAAATRDAALARVAQLETNQRDLIAEREALRRAALKAQQDRERMAHAMPRTRDLIDRAIYGSDYKRRSHYYLTVDMINAEIAKENEEAEELPPVPLQAQPAPPPAGDQASTNPAP